MERLIYRTPYYKKVLWSAFFLTGIGMMLLIAYGGYIWSKWLGLVIGISCAVMLAALLFAELRSRTVLIADSTGLYVNAYVGATKKVIPWKDIVGFGIFGQSVPWGAQKGIVVHLTETYRQQGTSPRMLEEGTGWASSIGESYVPGDIYIPSGRTPRMVTKVITELEEYRQRILGS